MGTIFAGTDLRYTNLVGCDLSDADLSACEVYGLSAWDITGKPKRQQGLIITDRGEPVITVDDITVAQFVHLMINNPQIRCAIDTITSKVVLILGRFTPDRKTILDARRFDKWRNGKCEHSAHIVALNRQQDAHSLAETFFYTFSASRSR